ncbi:MAG: 23S rRNA (guanosine(2251)-2'-O)-methyltransferase RlmB [Clostridia bacterium]|nr:23S rRNA (guanosine(2251)-2'-O)-methyltransferase RlmB [Clostridia bacterium]
MSDKIIGRNPVAEAIKSGREIDKIMVKKGEIEGSLRPIIKKARDMGIPVIEADRNKLDQLSEGGNHQGVIALVAAHDYASIDDIFENAENKGHSPFIIILDKITDPHNFGSIIRTANCAGADGIIIPKRGSVGLNEVVAKTSAGAIEYVPVCKVTNIAQTIDSLKDRGVWVAGAEAGGDTMYKTDLKGSMALVIGSEGEGISRLVKEKCDFLVEIPMFGDVNSLNASVAAAVLMYEIVRQRNN